MHTTRKLAQWQFPKKGENIPILPAYTRQIPHWQLDFTNTQKKESTEK
jgi:hypothetical protein